MLAPIIPDNTPDSSDRVTIDDYCGDALFAKVHGYAEDFQRAYDHFAESYAELLERNKTREMQQSFDASHESLSRGGSFGGYTGTNSTHYGYIIEFVID